MSSSPHDALFKAVFSEPEHARGALRAVLPAAVADAIDWPTLERRPGSFVDLALVERHTDLLFSVDWCGGGNTLVYLLFEHQSTPEPLMAFRLLRYLVRIWERWCSDHSTANQLPAIIPIVLYHGATGWSAPRSLEALLDVPAGVRPALAAHLIRFAYLLDDLSEIPDDSLRGRAMTALAKLAEVCFKHARTRSDLVEMLSSWADVLREVVWAPNGLEALARVMRYILLVNDHVEPDALRALLEREVSPEAKDTIVTAGERLIEQGVQQGIQQGIQQGVQQGIQQGVQQGKRALLLSLLRQRFGAQIDGDAMQRIAMGSEAQLDTWAARVLTASSLAELLAD